jgi:MbtH protein
MTANHPEDIYTVVVNHDEQYSIWLKERELPLGWKEAGYQGTRDACLEWIEQVWKDLRPMSLQKAMEAAKR